MVTVARKASDDGHYQGFFFPACVSSSVGIGRTGEAEFRWWTDWQACVLLCKMKMFSSQNSS